jgi:hypothetical protein
MNELESVCIGDHYHAAAEAAGIPQFAGALSTPRRARGFQARESLSVRQACAACGRRRSGAADQNRHQRDSDISRASIMNGFRRASLQPPIQLGLATRKRLKLQPVSKEKIRLVVAFTTGRARHRPSRGVKAGLKAEVILK